MSCYLLFSFLSSFADWWFGIGFLRCWTNWSYSELEGNSVVFSALSLVELCGFLALITFWSLTMNRMCSGWWPSPNCPSWWRVYSQLRTVSANKKLLKIYTSLEQPVVYGLLIITVLALELQQDSLFRLELQALLYPIMELDNLIMSLQLLRLWRRYPYPFLFLYIFLKKSLILYIILGLIFQYLQLTHKTSLYMNLIFHHNFRLWKLHKVAYLYS